MKKAGHKQSEIANVLERSESTISRELSRNCPPRPQLGCAKIAPCRSNIFPPRPTLPACCAKWAGLSRPLHWRAWR
ncbi:MAG: helix-turn-helix domain-containing protein [Nitrosomonadales bacterium]|nr:helix-turn-helix domain-containing protein [Nitrosomonadales bacterium]